MKILRLLLGIIIATFLCYSVGLEFSYRYSYSHGFVITKHFIVPVAFFVIALLLLWFLPTKPYRKFAYLGSSLLLFSIGLLTGWQADVLADSLSMSASRQEIGQAMSYSEFQLLTQFAEDGRQNSYFIYGVSLVLLLLGAAVAWATRRMNGTD